MSTKRQGLAFHTLTPDRRTPCGRWYGGEDMRPVRGLMLAEHEAREIGVECKLCFGSVATVRPVVTKGAYRRD